MFDWMMVDGRCLIGNRTPTRSTPGGVGGFSWISRDLLARMLTVTVDQTLALLEDSRLSG